MYNGVQNNYQDQVFYNLNRQFAGRGLARRAVSSAENGAMGAGNAPMTLDEFTDRFRMRSAYSPVRNAGVASTAAAVRNERSAAQRTQQRAAGSEGRPVGSRANEQRSAAQPPRQRNERMMPAEKKKTEAPKNTIRKRRAVKNEENSGRIGSGTLRSLALSVRQLPAGFLFVVMICMMSLMIIVGSSVLVSDASGDYSGIQDDVSTLAKTEDELLIALEVKNDLRTIESIAVNKLGMVKKDLVTRQYIKLSDEDIIETYDEEDRNVGLSTLLSAISKGN